MAENILFTLVNQYGNSLENFKFEGTFTFLYSYPNQKPIPVLKEPLQSSVAYGKLPKPKPGLEYTQLIIEFESEFYDAPGALLYKGQYPAPQNISVSKKTLDPEKRAEVINKSIETLKQVTSERVRSN